MFFALALGCRITGPHDADFEARAQLVLKDGVIKTLSNRIAHLRFALEEVTAEKEKLLSQPATIALQHVGNSSSPVKSHCRL